MATAIPSANIIIPYSEFLDQNTGRPSQAWLQWLMNPNIITQTVNNSTIKGGTIDNVAINNSTIENSTIDNVVINNSTIGLTTPAAGKFTDFTALNGVKGGTF
jgi:hypothetical protein